MQLPLFSKMLHGAGYNPEQWLDTSEISEKDILLMKKACINCVSIGAFSWSMLEPKEGEYNFEWLDNIINKLYKNGIYTVLSSPSAEIPIWLSKKYPEVLRVDSNRMRHTFGGQNNYCRSSPIYRSKINALNTRLAKRYANNPAIIMWHVSNEIQEECHCELCQEKFRSWLKRRYKSLDALNAQWWTSFRSRRYSDWAEIESPAENDKACLSALVLDWKRFCTNRNIDFYRREIAPIKNMDLHIPITINMMGFYSGIDYSKFAPYIDVISFNLPSECLTADDDIDNAVRCAMHYDMVRSMKKAPFLITDGTPLMHGQHTISKQKHPETYRLTAVQAIAHGANSIQYYQWRQSRGGSDKFQAAVISHNGKSDTRVFKQVSDTGVMLDALSTVCDSTVEAKVAIVYDIENLWAINAANGSEYTEAVLKHYSAFWRMGIPVDIIDMNTALEEYKLVIAPMAYMLKKGFDKKLKRFTFDGGVLVTTFFSFMTNENDLCYLGETPALGLSELNGIILEDVDALGKRRSNSVCMVGSSMGLSGSYEAKNICELIHIKTAEVLGVYGDDFYKDEPVFTVNEFGSGWAYYIGTDVEQRFFDDFYAALCNDLGIEQSIITELPFGVTVGKRRGAGGDLYFLQNFSNEFKSLKLPFKLEDIVNRTTLEGSITLSPYEAHICKRWLKLEAL